MKRTIFAACALALWTLSAAADGPVAKVKDAVDPDCTPAKAAKGAAMKATVGVGNRCDVGETARDVTGVDGKAAKLGDKSDGGALEKVNK